MNNQPTNQGGGSSSHPLLPFKNPPGACPKCGGSMKLECWCQGGPSEVDERMHFKLWWKSNHDLMRPGCTTPDEHLHVQCNVCKYNALMRTKDDPQTWSELQIRKMGLLEKVRDL